MSGAMDNWDHEGERVSEHDTALVLFQEKSDECFFKKKISETGIIHGEQTLKICYLVRNYVTLKNQFTDLMYRRRKYTQLI